MANYEMTQAQLNELYNACKPEPLIQIQHGHVSLSPQERVNKIWLAMGEEMGFDGTTARPVNGKGHLHFQAEAVANGDDTEE